MIYAGSSQMFHLGPRVRLGTLPLPLPKGTFAPLSDCGPRAEERLLPLPLPSRFTACKRHAITFGLIGAAQVYEGQSTDVDETEIGSILTRLRKGTDGGRAEGSAAPAGPKNEAALVLAASPGILGVPSES